MRKTDRFKPAVPKSVLLFLAGLAWFCVGAMLVALACVWLRDVQGLRAWMLFGIGAAAGLAAYHFGFQKIAAKNISRILAAPGRRCVFSFFAWKSYLLIIVMITMGRLFRHSAFPKPYLAVVYMVIGLALVLSSFKYVRVFMNEIRTAGPSGTAGENSQDGGS